ncbi:MAG: metallophosphoesterase, partial [Parabacteroides sp.]|nr:metallophosphoesterase [Parabacteroides sp.]
MIGYRYKILQTVLFIFILCACSTENNLSIEDFQINNDKTTQALYDIMYKSNDQTNETTLKKDYLYERFKIVHISDIHLSNWSTDNHYSFPKNLMEAIHFANQKNLKINAIVATGDLISNMETTTAMEARMYLSAFNSFFYSQNNIPSFFCIGNHDQNMLTDNTSYYLSKQDLNEILFNRKNYTIKQPFGENYFYADIKTPDNNIIRFISLDNTDQDLTFHKSI